MYTDITEYYTKSIELYQKFIQEEKNKTLDELWDIIQTQRDILSKQIMLGDKYEVLSKKMFQPGVNSNFYSISQIIKGKFVRFKIKPILKNITLLAINANKIKITWENNEYFDCAEIYIKQLSNNNNDKWILNNKKKHADGLIFANNLQKKKQYSLLLYVKYKDEENWVCNEQDIMFETPC